MYIYIYICATANATRECDTAHMTRVSHEGKKEGAERRRRGGGGDLILYSDCAAEDFDPLM
jgi:hypothetical protein